MTTTKVKINLYGGGEATLEGVREVSVPEVTNMKFKVTANMVDAAYYGVDGDLSWDEMKKIIQLAADQWLQTKGGGYVSLRDYDEVCKSHALLAEDYGSLCVKYKDLESDYEALVDELEKRGIKL